MVNSPEVDVVIAVHRVERPVARAVASVLRHTRAEVRVTVVAHGLHADDFRVALSEFAGDPRLRIVEFNDGVASPAGPMNHGLDLATGAFTSLLGSDDEFAPGAIDRWLTDQRRVGASAVIARIDMVGGGIVPQPPVRAFRRGVRDATRDRLAYRSAPLGLVSTREFGSLRLTEGLRTGEDLAYTAKVWFSGHPVVFAGAYKGYLGHADGDDRVTGMLRPIADELEGVSRIVSDTEIQELPRKSKEALAIKLVRVQIMGSLATRARLNADEQVFFDELIRRMLAFAPRVMRFLSLAEQHLLDSGRLGEPLTQAGLKWRSKIALASIWTVDPRYMFHAQSPLRYGLASLVVGKKGAR
ncbi:MAG: glycosyltransferase [Leucobacter sp.]